MSRTLIAVIVSLTLSISAGAEQVEVVLRDGLEGYAGTADFMMYVPASVADVNYGQYPQLSAGVNRWGEHLASVVRFDLSHLPAGATVQSARLVLIAHEGSYPFRDVEVGAHELTEANAGWIEGSGDGTRTPTEGAPCWNHLAYDDRPWAGEPGAAEAGVDYVTEWSAEGTCPGGGGAAVSFTLPPAVVQRWIERPATNAGVRLYPVNPEEKGDVAVFLPAEVDEPSNRPRLELTLQAEGAALAAIHYERALRSLRTAEAELQEAREEMARAGLPDAARLRLRQLRDELDRRLDALDRATADEATVTAARRTLEDQRIARASLARRVPVERGRDWVAQAGGPAEFALAVQSPMVKVLRGLQQCDAQFADRATVHLAANEHEAVQIVVVPLESDLEGVSWRIEGPDAPGVELSVSPVGYVWERHPAEASTSPDATWWPVPLLEYLDELDAPRGEVRPLWVDVHASADAAPGHHEATVTVRAENAGARTIRLGIEVFDFALPVEQHLKTIWGMTEGNFSRFYEERYDEEFAWKYFDMFLDHRLSAANLYRTHPTGEEGTDAIHHLANPEAMRRIRERGSGWWNIGYVLAPEHALTRDPWNGMEYEEYLQDYVGMLQEEMRRVRAADWPADRLGLYFLDETSDFEALGRAAEVMKENFPQVPLMTTGYDRSYGLEDTPVSEHLDIWVPLTPRYHEDLEKIPQGRELGKQAWWYICCGPRNATALNWFVQFPAIRARLLMGAASRRYAVDGFLYYRVAGWAQNDEPITGGPITDWNPVYAGELPDGDGQIICAGPDGPLTTVQLENIRDGIEDYEYWWLLDELIAAGQAPADVLKHARSLQSVPDELLVSVHEYSEDPALLGSVRLRLARAIERLRAAR